MRSRAATAGDLFAAKPFDPALYGSFALALAFSAPAQSALQLRTTSRACLWSVGLDWLIDHEAESGVQVEGIVDRCLAVLAGALPGEDDHLASFLAELQSDIGTTQLGTPLFKVWQDETRRMLSAMAREWSWNAGRRDGSRPLPAPGEYLANADNTGFCFVLISYWISAVNPNPDAVDANDIEHVLVAARSAQRAVRLLNDLGSVARDREWGDLNMLDLGPSPSDVERMVADQVTATGTDVAQLRMKQPELADYVQRQLEFCAGFYGLDDFWGEL
jgi:hypothetical protein